MASSISHEIEEGASAPPQRASRLWWWRVLGLIFALYAIEQNVEQIAWDFHAVPGAGTLGASFGTPYGLAPGFALASQVVPGGPADRAGVRDGDHVRFDHPEDYLRRMAAGTRVGFTIDHAGHRRHAAAVMAQRPALTGNNMLDGLTGASDSLVTIAILFGALLVLRSRESRAILLLGAAFVTYGLANIIPQYWTAGTATYRWVYWINLSCFAMIPITFYGFALQFRYDTIGRDGRWQRVLSPLYGLAQLLVSAAYGYSYLFATRLPLVGDGGLAFASLANVGLAASLGILIDGWRRSGPLAQRRYALLIVAIALVLVAQAVFETLSYVNSQVPGWLGNVFPWALFVAAALGGLVAPALASYAILRHKVFDLGFAVNRTLIYGTISTGLLLTFGLIEWGSERLLPHESLEASAVVNAGVALTIFVVFHRIRDFVERSVERLLFRSWHDNEARLRTFVKEAAFIGKPEALVAASVAAVSRFAGGADCALYLRDGEDFKRTEGLEPKVGERIDGDDPMAVTLRAEPKPLEPTDHGIVLALPMTHRAELDGFILLGLKLSGDSYRPDEIEQLAQAALQIGLDLHALKVGQLQAQTAGQGQEIALLKAQLQIALAGGMAQRA